MEVTKIGDFENKEVKKITIKNENLEISVLNMGAILYEFNILEKNRNIVLNYNDFNKYIKDSGYVGKTIAPTAGRIENAKYSIDKKIYQLDKNEGKNNLHGGLNDISEMIFEYKEIKNGILFEKKVKHTYNNLIIDVKYIIEYILNDYSLNIKHYAHVSDDVFINMTNHTYFNLNGKTDILNHYLKINSDSFYRIKKNKIPYIVSKKVENTEFDLREFKKLKDVISEIKKGAYSKQLGIDNPYKINSDSNELKYVASLKEDDILLNMYSTEDVVVCYTGNFLDNCPDFKNFKSNKYMGIALEPQNHPNIINYDENYKTTINKPYFSEIKYEIKIGGK